MPDPEHAPDHEYEVMGEPPSPFEDHVHVSWPVPELVGLSREGADGATGMARLDEPDSLVPIAFVAVTVRV